jgi:diguanylate cyclase (GGDEF)-like protein
MSYTSEYYDLFYKIIALLGNPNATGMQTEDILKDLNELYSADAAFVYEVDGSRLRLAVCAYGERAPELPIHVNFSWFSAPKLHFAYETFMTMPLRNDFNELICVVGAARVKTRKFARNRMGRLSSLLLAIGTHSKLQIFQRNIERLAFRDALTGVYNRRKFEIDFGEIVSRAANGEAEGFILFFDLDNFKRINDVFGHDVGDRLLVKVAQFLNSEPAFHNRFYRYGGDEFVALAEGYDEEYLRGRLDMILLRYSQPWVLTGAEVYCTSSIGIAAFPGDGTNFDELLTASDTAMYIAKRKGKNTFAFFDPKDIGPSSPEIEKEFALRRAVSDGCREFELLLYPITDAKTGLWVGAESLIRWNSQPYGTMRPNDFIPLCERLGLMMPLGKWIVNTAIKMAKAFRKYPDFCVSVNTSSIQTLDGKFTARAVAAAKLYGIDPAMIMFELTSAESLEAVKRITAGLQGTGFRVAIDGIGASQKPIFMLPMIGFDMVKADSTFGMRCLDSEFDREFARTLVNLSHTAKTKICAEGVCNARIRDFLAGCGYDYLQGAFFAEPMSLNEFLAALEKNRA